MKFSIIVPVYGVEKYLDQCVQSILSQSCTDFEVILVDDKSPDQCPIMCDEWAKRDSRIRVIHKPMNEGLGFARNTGIEAARGEYILFVDSDDYIVENTLEICDKQLLDGKDILVFGMELRYEDSAGRVKWCDQILPDKGLSGTDEEKAYIFSRLSANKVFSYACNKVYKRNFLLSIPTRFEKTRLIEDFLFNISVFEYASVIGILSQALYIYRKPAHETLASRYSPDFFELSKRKYLLERQFLLKCGVFSNEYFNQIHCGYVKHLISAIIKNHTKAASISPSHQRMLIKEMVNDNLTVDVMMEMQPKGIYKLVCTAINAKNVELLLFLARSISFMQRHLLPIYRRFV